GRARTHLGQLRVVARHLVGEVTAVGDQLLFGGGFGEAVLVSGVHREALGVEWIGIRREYRALNSVYRIQILGPNQQTRAGVNPENRRADKRRRLKRTRKPL